nr:MAG TPA: Putative tail fiber protein fold, Tail fiber, receptor [Caudoviricetes sp.]
MSILKGILHHWNKKNSAYDTIHPETEVAQVTDWNNGIVNTLASTALGGLVNTLTSDSLLATMIQKVLTATGVKYSIAQNGYLCFGSLFGGLIIQWGRNSSDTMIGFPIAFSVPPIIIGCHWGTHDDVNVVTKSDLDQSEKYNIYLLHSNYDGTVLVNWIAIGL